jgi:DNA repair exonuclease SbcCD nuclease subunit
MYKGFISENVAPKDARRIGIYDSNGNRVGQIPLGSLTPPTSGQKKYSFGALSDIHLQHTTAQGDFQRALTFFTDTEKVDFTCICGDLVGYYASEANLSVFKNYVDSYSPNTPVYAIAGNHDVIAGESENWASLDEATTNKWLETYTGHPRYYSFTQGNDVFVMVGLVSNYAPTMLSNAELQWLYETLEANRNKRCFVFMHVFPWDGSGDVLDAYHTDLMAGNPGKVFYSLMKHYRNVIWFHGHSHVRFSGQEYGAMANIDTKYGMYSVHISSCAVPKTGDEHRTSLDSESEGYVVDVYENGIHLRGRDFVKGEFLPIASYWLDTTLQTIPAKTYTDSTGTIKV